MELKLIRRYGSFIEQRCPKCGYFVLRNLWGQYWCHDKNCDYAITEITTDRPLPVDDPEEAPKPKVKAPARRAPAKKTTRKKGKE